MRKALRCRALQCQDQTPGEFAVIIFFSRNFDLRQPPVVDYPTFDATIAPLQVGIYVHLRLPQVGNKITTSPKNGTTNFPKNKKNPNNKF